MYEMSNMHIAEIFVNLAQLAFELKVVTLFSDIAMATSRARQRNGVVRRCAKAPRDVQNAARAAEKSVTIMSCETHV